MLPVCTSFASDANAPAVLPDRVRLPFRFDAARLAVEVTALTHDGWTAHFVRQNYDGAWDVLPLRAPAGETHPVRQIHPDPCACEFVDLPVLGALPGVREVLASLACPLDSVRLMRLSAGSRIKSHRDHDLAAEAEVARLHLPVVTNPAVTFVLNERPVAMAPGELWYLRLSDPHRVENFGTTDRIHLVIDVRVNEWLRARLAEGAACPAG